MKAASLFCFLLLCAGAAQSQSVFLQYEDPFSDGTALIGPGQIELELWIDFPAGAPTSERGGVNVLYDSARTSLAVIVPVLPTCPGAPPNPCVEIGFDDALGTISGFIIDAFPFQIQGAHHVATLIFDALDVGTAVFAVEEDLTQPFFIPVNFMGANVDIVLPSCESDSLPENFHDAQPATGLPSNWENIFVDVDPDSDGDGVSDQSDNCLLDANPSQCDTDGDNYGNHCDADFDNSCFVNFLDLATMKRNFFLFGALDTDLNCDGVTNFLDLEIMRQRFFQAPGPSGLPTACNQQNSKSGVGLPGWQTTAGANCDFNGDFLGDNVTGGLSEAACLEPSGAGQGAALCTSDPLELFGAISPILELHANYQPAGGLFQVIAGTAAPSAATLPGYTVLFETDAPLGAFQSLPGETLIIDLQSVAVTPLYVCVLVTGDFDYAEVDHCIACALSCGGGAPARPTRNPDCGFERN